MWCTVCVYRYNSIVIREIFYFSYFLMYNVWAKTFCVVIQFPIHQSPHAFNIMSKWYNRVLYVTCIYIK